VGLASQIIFFADIFVLKLKLEKLITKIILFNFMTKQQILDQNIITVLGLQALDDNKKMELINKISDLVQKRLTLKLVQQMTEAQKDEFDKLVEAEAGEEQMSVFLQQAFPNFLELAEQEVVKIKSELSSVVNKK